MKWNGHTLAVLALLAAAITLVVAGCAEQPDVTTETVDEIPEAAEEVFTDEPEEPGQEETSGVEVDEMVDETPPHAEGDESAGEAGEDEMQEAAPEGDAMQ